MITRDPLEVPCLTTEYWATFLNRTGRDLADTLGAVAARSSHANPLPRVFPLSRDERLRVEEENVRRSLDHASRHLFKASKGTSP